MHRHNNNINTNNNNNNNNYNFRNERIGSMNDRNDRGGNGNDRGYYNSYQNNSNGHNTRNDRNDKNDDRQIAYNQNLEQQLASQEKKTAHRRTVDHGNPMGRWYLNRSIGKQVQPIGKVRPEASYLIDVLPPLAYKDKPIIDTQTKFVHLSANKAKHAIHAVKWTPEGRRLVVASHSGEFTLWNGMTFNFETIMQAHDSAIFSLKYSNNDDWLLSGDQNGIIKFWQPNFNNVNIIQGHGDGIRDIAFSPNDSKFLTASDDSTMKIWNFNNGEEERVLTGHHWDVKSADWHPNLGLIVSGSKDNLIKLWDPRASNCVSTLHGFKHTIMKTRFQPNGTQRLLASVSRDRSARVFDLRTMKDILVLRDHEADLSCVSWHPIHSSMLTTAAYDGSMNHYILDSYIPDTIKSIPPVHQIPYAHEKAIHALEYHPLGHLLCSAGADRSARFWCRSRPNDPSAFQDAPYTDEKVGAWYYGVNNNVNAVSLNPAVNNNNEDEEEEPENEQLKRRYNLPGLNISNNNGSNPYGSSSFPGFGGIPGLGRN